MEFVVSYWSFSLVLLTLLMRIFPFLIIFPNFVQLARLASEWYQLLKQKWNIKDYILWHRVTQHNDIQHKRTQHNELVCDNQHNWHLAYMALSIIARYHYAECLHPECRVWFIVMLSVVMLSVIMLSVIMLSVVMLSVVMLSIIMINVVAPIYLQFANKRQQQKKTRKA